MANILRNRIDQNTKTANNDDISAIEKKTLIRKYFNVYGLEVH